MMRKRKTIRFKRCDSPFPNPIYSSRCFRMKSEANLKVLQESKEAYTKTLGETELVCECNVKIYAPHFFHFMVKNRA